MFFLLFITKFVSHLGVGTGSGVGTAAGTGQWPSGQHPGGVAQYPGGPGAVGGQYPGTGVGQYPGTSGGQLPGGAYPGKTYKLLNEST